LTDAGLEEACSGLIIFLTVALVQPMDDRETPLTVKPQAGKAGHLPGPVAIHYRREHIISPRYPPPRHAPPRHAPPRRDTRRC
jgi:hypothetical protein